MGRRLQPLDELADPVRACRLEATDESEVVAQVVLPLLEKAVKAHFSI